MPPHRICVDQENVNLTENDDVAASTHMPLCIQLRVTMARVAAEIKSPNCDLSLYVNIFVYVCI